MVTLRLFVVDASSSGRDRRQLARRIESAHADIACVQHAPGLLRWRSACAAIGRESGLVTVAGGRTGGGALLLSSLGVDVGGTSELAFTGGRGVRPPGAALASLTRLGASFVLVGARFAADRTAQTAQAAQLLRAVERIDPARPPAVICALHAGPGAANVLQEGRVTAAPGVFVDPRITVTSTSAATGGQLVELVAG